MKLNTQSDLLAQELQDLYSAETQLEKALPKMAASASNEELKRAFEEHLVETSGQVLRLETIAELEITKLFDIKFDGHTCKAMESLISEGEERTADGGEPELVDAALISAAQRVEHYEIAAYGTARALAETLGMTEVAELLSETLDEEKAADEKLTEIAESMMNGDARDTEGDSDEMETAQPAGVIRY